MVQKEIIIILVVFVIAIVIVVLSSRNKRPIIEASEQFIRTSHKDKDDSYLDSYYIPVTADIDNLLIDKLPCHPSCCSNNQFVSLDGLSADDLRTHLFVHSIPQNTECIGSNYTCMSDKSGVGCPCMTPEAYLNLVNRGQK